MKRVKSRKKLTGEEAKAKIENLAMELQNETEKLVMNLIPIKYKDFMEIDSATRFCLISDGYTNVEEAISETRKRIDHICWKIKEDYARFLPVGIHTFVTGLVIHKIRETDK